MTSFFNFWQHQKHGFWSVKCIGSSEQSDDFINQHLVFDEYRWHLSETQDFRECTPASPRPVCFGHNENQAA